MSAVVSGASPFFIPKKFPGPLFYKEHRFLWWKKEEGPIKKDGALHQKKMAVMEYCRYSQKEEVHSREARDSEGGKYVSSLRIPRVYVWWGK